MKKRILFLVLLSFCFPMAIKGATCTTDQNGCKQTSTNCTLTESQCKQTANCEYLSDLKCGIVTTENFSYTCYYYFEDDSKVAHVYLEAQFNASGLVAVDIKNDFNGPTNHKEIGAVSNEKTPIKHTNRNYGISYYTCPEYLVEYKVEEVQIAGSTETTYKRYYQSVLVNPTGNKIFYLQKSKNYGSGIMAYVPLTNAPQQNETTPTKEPKECNYYYDTGNNIHVNLIVTYVSDNMVTVQEVMDAGGNNSLTEYNTSFILASDEFKNWECASQKEIYIGEKDKVKYISYDANDIESITGRDPIKLEGDKGNSTGDSNLGEEQYGCNVVPDVVRKWIKIVLNFVKYIALVLVIILGTLDFIKAAGSGEADAMKKAGQSFLKRLVAVILLFLLPMLVDLILHLINLYGSTEDCFKILE